MPKNDVTDLTERVARAIREEVNKHDGPTTFDLLAQAAIREVLAVQREAVARSVVDGEENDYWGCCDITEARKFLAAFARENGLGTPAEPRTLAGMKFVAELPPGDWKFAHMPDGFMLAVTPDQAPRLISLRTGAVTVLEPALPARNGDRDV